MGYKSAKLVWESDLPSSQKLMAALVAHLVRDEASAGREALLLFASVETLARYLGVHPNNARRRLHALVRTGVLVRESKGGGRRRFGKRVAGIRATYRLCPERLRDYANEIGSVSSSVLTNEPATVPPETPTPPLGYSDAYPYEIGRALAGDHVLRSRRDEDSTNTRKVSPPDEASGIESICDEGLR